jgi:hypothetical protein
MEEFEWDAGNRLMVDGFKVERVVDELDVDDGAFPGKSATEVRLRDGGRGRRAEGVGVYIMLPACTGSGWHDRR